MDSFKATGADNIPAKVLKIAAPYISKVVTNIFNASYMSGKFPSIWKVAKVTPLYRVYQKKLNKPEIAHRLCKAPQCTKFFIEIGCLGTNNVV